MFVDTDIRSGSLWIVMSTGVGQGEGFGSSWEGLGSSREDFRTGWEGLKPSWEPSWPFLRYSYKGLVKK